MELEFKSLKGFITELVKKADLQYKDFTPQIDKKALFLKFQEVFYKDSAYWLAGRSNGHNLANWFEIVPINDGRQDATSIILSFTSKTLELRVQNADRDINFEESIYQESLQLVDAWINHQSLVDFISPIVERTVRHTNRSVAGEIFTFKRSQVVEHRVQ